MPTTIYRCAVCKATPQYRYTGLDQDPRSFKIHDYIKEQEDAAASVAQAKGEDVAAARRLAAGKAIKAIEAWGKAEPPYKKAKKDYDEAVAATKRAQKEFDETRTVDRSEGPNPEALRKAATARQKLLDCQDREAQLEGPFQQARTTLLAALHAARSKKVIDPHDVTGVWPCEECGARRYDAIERGNAPLQPMRVVRGRTRPRGRPVVNVDRTGRPTKVSFALYSGSYYSQDASDPATRPQMLDDVLADVTGQDGTLSDATSTLNVLLAPEFFLTQMGGTAPSWYMTHAQKQDVFGKLADVSAKYPTWVIAPGTACWYDDQHPTEKGFYNAQPFFFGGALVAVHCKRSLPGGELDPCLNDKTLRGKTIYSEPDEEGRWSEAKNVHGTFTLQGVTFGVEICNDYRCGVFKRSYQRLHRSFPPIDVFVFPAAGIMLNSSLKTYSEEAYANTDGLTAFPPGWTTAAPVLIGHRNVRLRQGGYLVHADADRGPLVGCEPEDQGSEQEQAAAHERNEQRMRRHAELNLFVAKKTDDEEECAALEQRLAGHAFHWLGKRPNSAPAVWHYVTTYKDLPLPPGTLV